MSEILKNYDRIHWQVKPKLGATEQLCKNLAAYSSGDLPPRVIDHVKVLVLDSLSCMLLGAETEPCRKLRSFTKKQGGWPECTVAYYGEQLNRYSASMLNGAFCQASGVDARLDGTLHCAGSVVGAALAVSEPMIREGNRLIAAIALGWEAACRIKRAAVCVPESRPLDPTTTFGPFGAAVAAGKLLEFSPFDLENAISLCPAQAAAPIRPAKTGSEIGYLHAGFAASWGVRSAYLAKEGLSGPRHILEGNMGFFKCVSGFHDDDCTTRYDVDLVNDQFGQRWLLEETAFVLSDGRLSEGVPSLEKTERKFIEASARVNLPDRQCDLIMKQVRELENADDCAQLTRWLGVRREEQ